MLSRSIGTTTARFGRWRQLGQRLTAAIPILGAAVWAAQPVGRDSAWAEGLEPVALAVSGDHKELFVACAAAQQVQVFDLTKRAVVRRCQVPGPPSGLATDGRQLYVTCAAPESLVCVLEPGTGVVRARSRTGHTALDPVLSIDRHTLFICLKFDNAVALWDVDTQREVGRIRVGREPVSLAPTRDGKFLLVSHHLPASRADGPFISATVGVVDVAARKMIKEIALPNGSILLRQIRVSPDGRYAALAHNLAHYQVPTTQVERGWMNTAALTILDVPKEEILATVLLDEVDGGAANPWAVAWSGEGSRLVITHAGTHEVSTIDFPGLLEKLSEHRKQSGGKTATTDDLSFLLGLRERTQLAANGPRAVAVIGSQVCVAGYFSDSLELFEIGAPARAVQHLPLQQSSASEARRGEALFNDATLCFQHWQSCASCHSEDARVDGLNWDLLNDGLGNPKNTKSLLLAHRTPPAMSTGVRYTAEEAVRAGIQHILFSLPSEDRAKPIDTWLKTLKPIPSPHLVGGELSAAAKRGERIFNSPVTGCAACHQPPLFTTLQAYDVATTPPDDPGGGRLDTPTLIELWRTAPYLHDGSAVTLREVLTTRNQSGRHGRTSQLSETELDDLAEYLLSL